MWWCEGQLGQHLRQLGQHPMSFCSTPCAWGNNVAESTDPYGPYRSEFTTLIAPKLIRDHRLGRSESPTLFSEAATTAAQWLYEQ